MLRMVGENKGLLKRAGKYPTAAKSSAGNQTKFDKESTLNLTVPQGSKLE